MRMFRRVYRAKTIYFMMMLLMLLSFLELDNMNRSNFEKKPDDLEKVSNMQLFDEYEDSPGKCLD